jgi:hypothetical protein
MNVGIDNIIYPLDEFYAARGEAPPEIASVRPEEMPEPDRTLLVHQTDMTSTLEKFYGESLHIHALASHLRGDDYFRMVVLVLDQSKRRIELGAIKINLALFSDAARTEILREWEPLGHILSRHDIVFSSRPAAFLRLEADLLIASALHVKSGVTLFGRRNVLLDTSERPLAEIVEILPR